MALTRTLYLVGVMTFITPSVGDDVTDILKGRNKKTHTDRILLSSAELKQKLDASTGQKFRDFRLPLEKYKVAEKDRVQMLPGHVIYSELKLLEYNALERHHLTFHTKIVPYYFDDSWGDLLPGITKLWDPMISDLHRLTCLRFKKIDPSTHKGRRIKITMSGGSACFAVFGVYAHIGRECWGVLFHELGHALHMSELSLAASYGPYAQYMMDPGHYLRWSGKNPMLDYTVDQRLYNTMGQMDHYDIDKLNKMYDCGPNFDRMANGGWSEWSWWTACDTSCKRFRTRFCTADDRKSCAGPNREDQQCPASECDLNQAGGYAAWTDWKSCSKACGGGYQFRHRYCLRPIPAANGPMCPGVVTQVGVADVPKVGVQVEHRPCNSGPCTYGDGTLQYQPVGCYRSTSMLKQELFANLRKNLDWKDPVNTVIKPCARGAQMLDRQYFAVEFYGECWTGPNSGVDLSKLSPSTDCNLGMGAGNVMFIYRILPSSDMDGAWAEWSGWTGCSSGQRTRSRTCSNPAKLGNGQPCPGSDSESEACSSDDAFTPRVMSALEHVGCYSRSSKMTMYHNARANIDWTDFKKTVLECAREAYARDIQRFGIAYWGECWSLPDDAFSQMSAKNDKIADDYTAGKALLPYGCFKHMVGMELDLYVYNLKVTKSAGGASRPVGWQSWSQWSGCETLGLCGTQRPPAKERRFRDCYCWDRAECSSQCTSGSYHEESSQSCPANSPCPAFRDRGCWLNLGQVHGINVIPLLDTQAPPSGQPEDKILACAVAAKAQGYPGFVLKVGGLCASSSNILRDYSMYGIKRTVYHCPKGIGGTYTQQVYEFTG